jgi:hypothetical protein
MVVVLIVVVVSLVVRFCKLLLLVRLIHDFVIVAAIDEYVEIDTILEKK